MRQSGYQQQYQIQQQRVPHFMNSNSQRIQTVPNELPNQMINSPQSMTRKTMYASSSVSSSQQAQPRMAVSPQNQRFSSPMPRMGSSTGYTSPLSNSNLSLVNGQLTNGVSSPNNYQNTLLQSSQNASTTNLTSSQNLNQNRVNKANNTQFTSISLAQSQNQNLIHTNGDSIQMQSGLIKDLDSQVKKLKEELQTVKVLQQNTQKHNDDLIKKIKVLINENEKMQQKELDEETQKIQQDQKLPQNIQLLLLENKRFQGIIRDLESKAKLLILENEKQQYLLRQSQVQQAKTKTQNENDPFDSGRTTGTNTPTLNEYKERCIQLEKKLELQSSEQKNIQNLASTWEQKLDLLLQENEKLQRLVKEKLQQNEGLSKENTSLLTKIKELKFENEKLQKVIEENGLPEQQMTQMEIQFQAMIEENNRINQLLVEKNIEHDKKKLNSELKNISNGKQCQQDLTSQNQSYKQEIQIQFETIQLLKQQLQLIQNNNSDEMKSNYFKLQQDMVQIKKEYSQQILRFEAYIKEYENEKEQMSQLNNQKVNEQKQLVIDLQKKLERSESKLKSLQGEYNEKCSQVQQKIQEANQLKQKQYQQSVELERYKKEIDDHKKQILERQIEIAQKQSQIDQLENKIDYQTKDKENLKNENSQLNLLLQSRKEQVDIANKNLSETRDEVSKYLTNNFSLQQENTTLQINNKNLSDSIKKLEEKVYEIEDQQKKQQKSKDITVIQKQQNIINETSQKQTESILRILELEKNLQQKLFSVNSAQKDVYNQKY